MSKSEGSVFELRECVRIMRFLGFNFLQNSCVINKMRSLRLFYSKENYENRSKFFIKTVRSKVTDS